MTSDPKNLLAENAELRQQTEMLALQVALQRERLEVFESSAFFRLKQRMVRFLNVCGLSEQEAWLAHQAHGVPGILYAILRLKWQQGWRWLGRHFPPDPNQEYDRWMRAAIPDKNLIHQLETDCRQWRYRPIISLLMPVYNPPEVFLIQALESVLAQAYPFWELCIADDASTLPYVRQVIEKFAVQDTRIKVRFLETNGHISRASNAALELAAGEFIGLIDHDDLLAPDALFEVVQALNTVPETDFLYSDEDKVSESNILSEPYFKPDWSPDFFLSQMYTGHFSVYRRELVQQLGGFRTGFEGSQDYDLVLRVTEQTSRIIHIPKVLYHWRMHQESASSNHQAKPYAYVAAKKAISEALTRRGEPGTVQINIRHPGYYTVRYTRTQPHSVGFIIFGNSDGNQFITGGTTWFAQTSLFPAEVAGCVSKEAFQQLQKLVPGTVNSIRWIDPGQVPFPELLNQAVAQTTAEILLFLRAGMQVETSEWIELLVEQAQREGVGAVGGAILQPGKLVQSVGLGLNQLEIAAPLHKGLPAYAFGYHGTLITNRNVAAIPLAGLMCRRKTFLDVGGLNPHLKVRFWDVDLCLRMLKNGYRNICLPQVRIVDPEPVHNRHAQMTNDADATWMRQQWDDWLKYDPYYNCNLSRQPMDFSMKVQPDVSSSVSRSE